MSKTNMEGLRVSAAPLRMEASVNGVLTVLEGEELAKLIGEFFKAVRDPNHEGDTQIRYLFAFGAAMEAVYGDEVAAGKPDSPNARKMELFVHGMCELAAVM